MANQPAVPTNAPIESQILEGLAMYAFVHAPDKGNTKHRIPPSYKIEVCFDKPEQLTKAQSLGLNIREAQGQFEFPYVSFRSKVKEGRTPPRIMDAQRNPIPSSILIGNGSRVRVRFLPFEYGAGEISAILQDTQVLELIKYEPPKDDGESFGKANFLGKVEGGFTLPPELQNKEPVA